MTVAQPGHMVGLQMVPKQQLAVRQAERQAGRQQVTIVSVLSSALLDSVSTLLSYRLLQLPGHHPGHRRPVPGGGGGVRVHRGGADHSEEAGGEVGVRFEV